MSLMYETTLSDTNMRQSMMMMPHPPSTTAAAAAHQQQQNAADTLPTNINFGFEDLRERMARFTLKFDAFIAEGRKRVLDERNEYRSKIAELAEDHKMKDRSIEILSSKATSHAQTIAKEQAESQELLAAIEKFSLQRDQRIDARDRLRVEIASTQKLIAQRLEVQKQYAAKMDAQARYNLPELDFWVDYLCMRIEGVGRADELQFVFTHVDPQDWEREASFELLMSEHEYRVERCRPKIEKERLRLVVDRVNESRDVAVFLKGMRELFVEVMK